MRSKLLLKMMLGMVIPQTNPKLRRNEYIPVAVAVSSSGNGARTAGRVVDSIHALPKASTICRIAHVAFGVVAVSRRFRLGPSVVSAKPMQCSQRYCPVFEHSMPTTAEPGIRMNMKGIKLTPARISDLPRTARKYNGQKKHTSCKARDVVNIMYRADAVVRCLKMRGGTHRFLQRASYAWNAAQPTAPTTSGVMILQDDHW